MSASKPSSIKLEWMEIKTDLMSEKKDRKKDALKKLIGLMTIGKDVSSLFTDVVNCIQSDRLEIKKLVYLYLMNYAKTKPELALLAVNTFIKDTSDQNPLIKALALRTMGCIHVDKITEYLTGPLERCLRDEDPYVRKTAAICVAKMHALNPQLVADMGFLKMLSDLLSDGNPMVVANSVATFSEIISRTPSARKFFEMNSSNINKLLTALNECTEWGQIFILDSIVNYNTDNQQELKSICERVTPRLSHANSAVVLSATKVLLKFISKVENDEPFIFTIFKKISPPLVTLLSLQPEIQYVALRNINLITQKFPKILSSEIRAFFIKYNDPIFVKLEKLEIMIRLVSIDTVDLVLNELREYATEVDVDFVKKSVRAIGRCALKVEVAAESCVATLEDLIATKVNYVVQESVIVIKDILRKYPNKYEGVIGKLSESLDSLDDPEARASMIWILGEYCERIDNSSAILASFLDGFFDESTNVQLQLLTAVVKLFLKNPVETQELVQRILTMVTQECGNPDLRDRGFVYWRLLSADPNSAREIVLSKRANILEETTNLDSEFLDELLLNLSTLSSIYHKTPHTFIHGSLWKKSNGFKNNDVGTDLDEDEATFFNDDDAQPNSSSTNANTGEQAADKSDPSKNIVNDLLLLDLDGGLSVGNNPDPINAAGGHFTTYNNSMLDIASAGFNSSDYSNFQMNNHPQNYMFGSNMMMGDMSYGVAGDFNPFTGQQIQPYSPPKETVLDAASGLGMEVKVSFSFRSGISFFDMTITNTNKSVLSNFSLFINKNSFGISVSPGAIFPKSLGPQQPYDVSIPLNFNGQVATTEPINMLQCAIMNNVGTFTFNTQFPLHFLFQTHPSSSLDAQSFGPVIEKFPAFPEGLSQIQLTIGTTPDTIVAKLKANSISIANKTTDGVKHLIQCYCALKNNIGIVFELSFMPSTNTIDVNCKSTVPSICSVMVFTLRSILLS